MWAEIERDLRVTDAPAHVAAALRRAATFPNPERAALERLGRRSFRVPETTTLWRSDGPTLVLPRGLDGELRRLAPLAPVRDRRVSLAPVPYRWRGELRPEQKTVCRAAFDAGGGVVVGPCGSGKTQIGLGLAAAWRQPTLWLVHTLDLARQALERARDLFDLPDSAFGFIGGGEERVGSHLTVATVQTLMRRDLAGIAGRFGCVILDEAHHAPAATFCDVLQAFPARYRLGLTATPDRADGLGPVMLAVLGPVVARLTTAALAAAGRVVVPTVRQVPTQFRYPYRDDFSAMLTALCADGPRNELIAGTVAAEARAGHLGLVLSERVEHCHTLAEALASIAPEVPSVVLTGSLSPKRRAEALQAMREAAIQVAFATRVADEGLDVPRIDRVFLATGGRAAGRVAQQVGRAMRPDAGKAGAVVFDFCDWACPVLAAQARARERAVYAPLGARVRREAMPA